MAIELRIHGVSGTPADQVIGGATVPDDRFDSDPATTLRLAEGDGRLLAYRWASQTSGSPSSALWFLLVPYMLLNLAGWALPPADSNRHRAAVAVVRIAGLFLTLVFGLITASGVIGVGAYQVLRPTTSWSLALTLGIAVSVVVMGALWFATTRAGEARNDRPYLRAPHIAVALWGIWATAVTAAAEASGTANPIGTMWLLPAALAVLTAAASLWRGLEDVTRVFGRVAVGAVLVLLISVVVRPLDTVAELPGALTSIGGPLRAAVLAYALIGLIAMAVAWSKSHIDAGPAVGSLLALAGSTGAAVGAGAVVLSGIAFGVAPAPALGTLAEAFVGGTLCVIAATALHMWTHLEPAATPRDRLLRTLASVRDDLRPLLLTIPVVTVAVGALGLGRFETALLWVGAGSAVLAIVAVTGVGLRVGYRGVPIGVAVGGALSIVVVGTGVVSFQHMALGFTLVLPAAVVITRIIEGFRNDERRRTLAIPWDVGSFFSRRFHPFAPPTYRDAVTRDLKLVLTQLRSSAEPVVVSAHSQGSIVAVAALDAMPADDFRLLTHGSPLATLYMRFFPVSFPPETLSRIAVRPWVNLWRPTDPIGGAVRGADDRKIEDHALRGHVGYWREDEEEYVRARDDLLAAESRP